MRLLNYLCLLLLKEVDSQPDVPVVCGGYVKAVFRADFSKIKINLYSVDGTLKYSSDCSADNGYFLLPVYDQGDYLVRLISPEGWVTSPSEVPLSWKGGDDPCAGKDILFELLGFRLQGQVSNVGRKPGSAGVQVHLATIQQKQPSINIFTLHDGKFLFEGVVPGTYQLSISHPVWKVTQDILQMAVEEDSVTAPLGLEILGYDAKGSVRSGGEPVHSVRFYLFSQDSVNSAPVQCEHSVNDSVPASLENQEPLCVSSSDESGKFVFVPLPPGHYYIVPYYQQNQLQFEVQPTQFNFTILNDSVILLPKFEVQGFSVSGYVSSKKKGSPVVGAKISLGDVHAAVSNKQGFYSILNVTSGSYRLMAEASGMEFENQEVHISPSSPSLPTLFPSKYLFTGKVTLTIPISSPGKQASREIEVRSVKDKFLVDTTTTDSTGKFSLYLPLGTFKIKVVVSEGDAARGLKVLPAEKVVSVMGDPAPPSIEFSQFTAKVTGTVNCIKMCPDKLSIKLERKSELKQSLTAQVQAQGEKAKFLFTGVLPGSVEVSLRYDDWCWEKSKFSMVVDDSVSPPTVQMTQTGYTMQYDTSHATLMSYRLEGESGTEVNISGTGVLCLKKPGVYTLTPKSCHSFGDDITFKTSSPQKVVLRSVKHKVIISVHCEVEDPHLKMAVKTKADAVTISSEKVNKINGTFVYSFSTIARAGEGLILDPKSSQLMFSPSTRNWKVGNDCPELVTPFQGSLGEIVEGKVLPPLAGVTVTLTFGEKERIRTVTDQTGLYRAGPFHGGKEVEVTAERIGYKFELQEDSRTFNAIKLSEVNIKVASIDGKPLPRVLVSVTGESLRQTSFTDDNGILAYNGMAPGQYFIKPFLREYDFMPSSKSLVVAQGNTEDLDFVGRRVAFSCSGHVLTLNRRPVAEATIQATGQGTQEGCSSYSETALSNAEGVYTLLGLLPGCLYTVFVKQDDFSAHYLPSSRSLTVEEGDVKGLDFFMVQKSQEVFISGWVKTETKFIGTLKVFVSIHGSKESPIHIVSVDPVGFFEFPSLPSLAKGNYVVSLETNLASNSFKYSSEDHVVSGNEDSYIIMKFSAKEVLTVNDLQSKGSVVALIMVILAAFALVNFEVVIFNVRSYFKRSTSGVLENKKTLGKAHKK